MNVKRSIRRITAWLLICVWLLCMVGPVHASAPVYSSESQAAEVIRQAMVERQETVTITYSVARENLKEEVLLDLLTGIYQKAIVHTEAGNEGDYLYFHKQGYKYGYEYSDDGVSPSVEVSLQYTFFYYTTASQEAELTTKVNQVLTGLNLDGKTDYEKAKAIYDYLCQNITYDYANLNNEAYTLKYSAYAAMVNKTSVCQGYANLFYRLANAAGLDARIISGSSMGQGHAWNIVKIDGKYYNVDSTWDAGRANYSYFLKGSSDFADHTPHLNHPTDGVTYPISATNYVIPTPEKPAEKETEVATTTQEPTTTERSTEEATEEETEVATTTQEPTTTERSTEEATEEETETPTTTQEPTTTERPTEEPTEEETETTTTTEAQSPTTEEGETGELTEEETERASTTEDETAESEEKDPEDDSPKNIFLVIEVVMIAGTALVVSAAVIKRKQR